VTTAAALKLWSDSDEWREAYLGLKDTGRFEFETGFNVCGDPNCAREPLQRGAVTSKTFTFTDWKNKGLPERTCEELGNCSTPSSGNGAGENSTLHPISVISVLVVLLIGVIALVVLLFIKAKKGK